MIKIFLVFKSGRNNKGNKTLQNKFTLVNEISPSLTHIHTRFQTKKKVTGSEPILMTDLSKENMA
jgi:hypothetical protein